MSETELYPLSAYAATDTWRPFYHHRENYAEGGMALARYLSECGVTTVFQGNGGDELVENRPELYDGTFGNTGTELLQRLSTAQPWLTSSFHEYVRNAVRGDASRQTTLLPGPICTIASQGNNAYLDYNIWPVNPLASAPLYYYCQTLPIRYRYKKNMLRMYMKARGYPESIYSYATNEHFSHFFFDAVRQNLRAPFVKFLQSSVLANSQFIDADDALRTWDEARDYEKNAQSGNPLFILYRLLILESNLQTIGISKL
jgi:hypothetical protein